MKFLKRQVTNAKVIKALVKECKAIKLSAIHIGSNRLIHRIFPFP